MDTYPPGRRDFLKKVAALGAAGLPVVVPAWRPRPVYSAHATARFNMKTAYDPAARLEITVSEVELRRTPAGRMLMARIYQPNGPGPFPTILDLHGGAWNAKDRHAEEPMDRALAASGVLVVAIDMTLAPEAPYPVMFRRKKPHALSKSKAATNRPQRSALCQPNSPRPSSPCLRDARSRGPRCRTSLLAFPRCVAGRNPWRACSRAAQRRRDEEPHHLFCRDTIQKQSPNRAPQKITLVPPDHGGASTTPCLAVEIRRDVQGGRRRLSTPRVRGQRTRVGRHTGAANRPRARDGQGVHREPIEDVARWPVCLDGGSPDANVIGVGPPHRLTGFDAERFVEFRHVGQRTEHTPFGRCMDVAQQAPPEPRLLLLMQPA